MLEIKKRINQISIGFRQEQIEWLDEHKGINIHLVCRDALDEQIELDEE